MLEKFKAEGRSTLIPYLVVGHPSLEATERFIDVLVAEGVELIELGVPFSDAMADGPVIQAASETTSQTVSQVSQVLELASRVHQKHPALGLILFTYFNPLFKMGMEAFAQSARRSGISAVLVVDLPPEESQKYRSLFDQNQLQSVFLVAPTTSPERIKRIAEVSTGFIYFVSRTGVTGVRSELSSTWAIELEAVRAQTSQPIAVGFGISTGAQAREVAKSADAVVVGSAFVKIVTENPDLGRAENAIRKLAKELIQSIHQAR